MNPYELDLKEMISLPLSEVQNLAMVRTLEQITVGASSTDPEHQRMHTVGHGVREVYSMVVLLSPNPTVSLAYLCGGLEAVAEAELRENGITKKDVENLRIIANGPGEPLQLIDNVRQYINERL